jgi:acetyl esterase
VVRRVRPPQPPPRANPDASPLESKTHADLPPATIQTAGFDPLRDQGHASAEAREAAGVDVTFENDDEMIHGFFSMLEALTELDDAHAALGVVGDDLEAAWS